jgi:transposase
MRAQQMAMTRRAKRESVEKLVKDLNKYLAQHGKSTIDAAVKKVKLKIEKLRTGKWLSFAVNQRIISLETDESALEQVSLLDGCYVIKSDVPKDSAKTQVLHDRYCDLENVERAFRTMKTAHLEMRPVFVRKEQSTKGHVFVVMLAFLLQRELERSWVDLDLTVEEGINELAAIHMEEICMGSTRIQNIPTPNEMGMQLLKKAGVNLPSMLPSRPANVHTKKKLPSERIK